MKNLEKQINLLRQYWVSNYTVENGKITINGSLYLESLTSIPDSEFLKGTTINGYLHLRSLTSIPDSEFLKGTTINGSLYLGSLTSIPDSEFLKGTTINGSLYLESLTSIPDSEFLKGTTINVSLFLGSLAYSDRRTCQSNVNQLTRGYNKENNYCYFDGILAKVLRVSKKKEYTIYTTPIGFVAEKGEFTAHGNTIKKAIQDVEFKVVSEKLKNEPIHPDTLLTVKHYRLITGACDSGCRSFMRANGIEYKVIGNETVETTPIKAKDLLPILEKSNAYGYEKFKSLIIG